MLCDVIVLLNSSFCFVKRNRIFQFPLSNESEFFGDTSYILGCALSSVFDFSKEKIHILGIHLDISVH
jgi:hypothetical protein